MKWYFLFLYISDRWVCFFTAMRDLGPIGPGRRRMDERQNRRTRERDSMERRGRRGDREESHVNIYFAFIFGCIFVIATALRNEIV